MALPFSWKPHPGTQAPQRIECYLVPHACCSWVQGASRKMFWLVLHGALSHKTFGLNSVWGMYTAILRYCGWEERSYFLAPVFSSCRPVLPRNKEEHFYLQIHISLLPVFWDGKEDAIFLKRLGNNSFLSVNCLPCVWLVPINCTEEHKMWSSTAQHWHYCWRDQVYRPESAVTLRWGYAVILSRKPSLMTSTRCALPFLIPHCLYFIIGNIDSVTSHFFYFHTPLKSACISVICNVTYIFYPFSNSRNLSKQRSWLIFFS